MVGRPRDGRVRSSFGLKGGETPFWDERRTGEGFSWDSKSCGPEKHGQLEALVLVPPQEATWKIVRFLARPCISWFGHRTTSVFRCFTLDPPVRTCENRRLKPGPPFGSWKLREGILLGCSMVSFVAGVGPRPRAFRVLGSATKGADGERQPSFFFWDS